MLGAIMRIAIRIAAKPDNCLFNPTPPLYPIFPN
jgi:hypothetical protein